MTALETIKSKIAEYLPDLRKRYPIDNLALFGSVTREDFNPETSDNDILVEFYDEFGWEFFDLESELKNILKREVDLVSKRAIKPHYWESIEKNLIHV